MIVSRYQLTVEDMGESLVQDSISPAIGPDVLPGTVTLINFAILFIVHPGIFTLVQLPVLPHRTAGAKPARDIPGSVHFLMIFCFNAKLMVYPRTGSNKWIWRYSGILNRYLSGGDMFNTLLPREKA
jgi:hypothetical protein